jgi:hypothetical protein
MLFSNQALPSKAIHDFAQETGADPASSAGRLFPDHALDFQRPSLKEASGSGGSGIRSGEGKLVLGQDNAAWFS